MAKRHRTLIATSGLLLLLLMVWTHAWFYKSSIFEGDWKKDIRLAADIQNGSQTHYTSTYRPVGYPLFILLASGLLKQGKAESVHMLMYVIWLIGLAAAWAAVWRRLDASSANMVVFFLLLYLYYERFYSISLLTEPLYCSLLLVGFSLWVFWSRSGSLPQMLMLGIVLCLAQKVRPGPLYGIAAPLAAYLVFRGIKDKAKSPWINLAVFGSGVALCQMLVWATMGVFYDFRFPTRSIAYPATMRVLHHDGICRSENGPASRRLLEVDETILGQRGEKHRDGCVYENADTYEYVLNTYGIAETERLYWAAAKESVSAYPWISVRNTLLNVLSYLLNYDLLFVETRRNSPQSDFPINPVEWGDPLKRLPDMVSASIERPFWILLIIVLASVPRRVRKDPVILLYIVFCAVSIGIASVFGRYLYRYAWPLFVVSFIPLGIAGGQAYALAWPLILPGIARTASLIVYFSDKLLRPLSKRLAGTIAQPLLRGIDAIVSYKITLGVLLIGFTLLLLLLKWKRPRPRKPIPAE